MKYQRKGGAPKFAAKKTFQRAKVVTIARSVSSPSNWAKINANGKRPFEIKALDVPDTVYVLSAQTATNANVKLINPVQEGAGFFNRIGRRINMRSLHMKGTIRPIYPYLTQTQDDFVRIAIVYDRQPSAAASTPSYDTIFKDYPQTGTAVSSVLSGINLDNRERFIILRDFSTFLPRVDSGSALVGPSTVQVQDNEKNLIDEFIKLKGLETHFNGTTNPLEVTSISTGSLLIVTQGKFALGGAAGTVPAWEVVLKFRLRYDDA